MKIFYFSIPLLFLLFIGCSSTYKVTDYPSKKDFYEDFNTSAKDTKVKVTLINNSSLVVFEGAEIKNDTLHLNFYPSFYPSRLRVNNENYLLTEIKQASYTNHWKAILPGWSAGLFGGAFIGTITTAYILDLKSGGNHPERDWYTGLFFGGFYGMVAGAIIGAIIGWTNIYQFNP